jgi:thiol-disulfide isomerase/thioredoxin
MRRISLSRVEKLCFAGMVFLAALMIAVLNWWHAPQETKESRPETTAGTLATPEDKLPQNLFLGQVPPATKFTDAGGKEVSLSAYRGSPLLVLFWGSWCKYCKEQLDISQEIAEIADRNGAKVLLVDKLDPERETRSAALSELHSMGLSFPNWFDGNLKVYGAWGLRQIPTSVILDAQGNAAAYATGVLTAGEYEGLFEYALKGGNSATASFLAKHMTNQSGGVYCNAKDSGATPGGHDVLSETQGLMMQYAVLSRNKSLFDAVWDFTKEKMEKNGLAAWYFTKDGKAAGVNATLDDLRIWSSLADADDTWGGYAQAADAVCGAIDRDCVRNDHLVNFYEFSSGKKSNTLSLCYGDLSALRRMAQTDARFSSVAENTLETVRNGYISDNFPFYYSSYDYDKKSYSKDDLNTAEALTTLWNLAKAGELKAESLAWLKKQVSGEGLAARYHVSGSAVQGCEYHSTAVYALTALIAGEEGDRVLYNAALQKMERYRNGDAGKEAYGAFGDPDAGDFPAFDQCMPLLVYAGKRP